MTTAAPATGFGRAGRYALAGLGPVGMAGSQFLLSVQMLAALPPAHFGSFSFLLVMSNFATGVWSAMFCAPLPALLATADDTQRDVLRRCLFAANLVAALCAFVLFFATALLLNATPLAAALFGAYVAFMLLRWYARAYAYARGIQLHTVASDLIYSTIVVAGGALTFALGAHSVELPYAALLAAAVVGLLPFGGDHIAGQFSSFSWRDFARYRDVWRTHSGWSVIGVVTTEATANAHAYIVTLATGSAAFAPIAASALFIRPVGVAQNALAEFERPQIARHWARGERRESRRAVLFLRCALAVAWLGNVAAALALMACTPQLAFPHGYSPQMITVGAAFWIAIAAVRLLRTPESTLLQASGAFRPLAFASIASSGISIAAVLALLLTAGPLWSVLGILLGEMVFAVRIWGQAGKLLKASGAMA